MPYAPLVPSLDVDVHLVLCRFGRAGLAYVETDPTEADATTVVRICFTASTESLYVSWRSMLKRAGLGTSPKPSPTRSCR